MAIFGQKPWDNHFLKMSIFQLCKLFVFMVYKSVFCHRLSLKIFSWPILPKKKNLEKRPFFDHNHGLTPLKKCKIFRLFELIVFIA